jgi:hypothetical protein
MTDDRKPKPPFSTDEEFTQTATGVLRRLHALIDRAENISTLNTFRAFRHLNRVATDLQAERRDYFRCLEFSYVKMSTKITSSVGFAGSLIHQNTLAGSLPLYLRLENTWSRVNSTVEYKRAYAVAILAVYLSVLSCLLALAIP